MKYIIYPTLFSEIKKGTVWTYYRTDSNLIKIKNKENNKSIIVAYRKIDKNFINKYDKPGNTKNLKNDTFLEKILFDEYYRNKLGVSKYDEVELEIKPVKSFVFWYKLLYLKNHPDEVVNITFWFAFLTFIFTLFSYIISFEKLIKVVNHIFNCLIEIISIIFK